MSRLRDENVILEWTKLDYVNVDADTAISYPFHVSVANILVVKIGKPIGSISDLEYSHSVGYIGSCMSASAPAGYEWVDLVWRFSGICQRSRYP